MGFQSFLVIIGLLLLIIVALLLTVFFIIKNQIQGETQDIDPNNSSPIADV